MPAQHNAICTLSTPLPAHPGNEADRSYNRTTEDESICRRLRGRRDGFCKVPCRHPHHSYAVRTFERATDALLNPQKSKALAVGNWAEPPTILGIDFCH